MSTGAPAINTQWRLTSRPTGEVGREHFEVTHTPLPEPGEGEVRVRNLYLLIPPSMRLWMNDLMFGAGSTPEDQVRRADLVRKAGQHPEAWCMDVMLAVVNLRNRRTVLIATEDATEVLATFGEWQVQP